MLYYTRFFLGYSNKIWAEGTMGKVHAPGGGGYWLRGRLVVRAAAYLCRLARVAAVLVAA